MASANLELVQSLFERWERAGVYFGSAEWAHPDITLSLRATSPALLEEILDAWFEAAPSSDSDDVANIRHVDEIAQRR